MLSENNQTSVFFFFELSFLQDQSHVHYESQLVLQILKVYFCDKRRYKQHIK